MGSRLLQKKRAGGPGGGSPAGRRPSAPTAGAGTGRLGGSYGMGPAVKLGGGAVQTKLTVGKPGDRFEHEADRVADSVSNGGKAGDVSRIPAGGLASQRQAEENEPAQTQGEERAEEGAAQPKCAACEAREKDQKEGKAQRQADEGSEEGEAQTKCAACEAREKEQKEGRAQRQADEGAEEGAAQSREEEKPAQTAAEDETESAQIAEGEEEKAQTKAEDDEPAQTAAEEGEENAQTAAEEGGEEAQTAEEEEPAQTAAEEGGGIEETPVQRQAEEGEESTGAAAEGVEGAEDAQVADCDGPGGGEAASGADREGGPEEEEGEAGGEEGARPGAQDDLGCGGGGGEGEGGAEEVAAGAGGQSCGATDESGEAAPAGGEGGGPAPEGAAPAEGEAPPPAGSAPTCATEVEAAEETPDEGQGEEGEGASPAAGGSGAGGECGTAQRQAEGDEAAEGAETAQTHRAGGGRARRLDTGTASRLIRSRGAGEPMPPMVRGKLEGGLGVDLRDVRVHADGNAQAANRALRAKAFAHGKDIFLGAGQSPHDVGLMAHETTHVLQQDGVTRRKPVAEAEPASPGGAAQEGPGPAASTSPVSARSPASPPEAASDQASTPARGATAAPPAGAPPPPPTGTPTGTAAGSGGTAPDAKPGADATAAGTAEKAQQAARDGKKGRGKGGAGGGGGGAAAGGGEEAAVAGPAGGEGPAFPHPGAAAAAAAREAEDRRNRQGVKLRLRREAGRQKGPAASPARQRRASADAAGAASAAAPSPDSEPRAQAGEVHTDALAGAKPGKVGQATFLELVKSKLDSMKTPGSLEEMDDFKEQGGAGELKAGLDQGVESASSDASGEIEKTLGSPPKPPDKRQEKPLAPVPATPPSARLSARRAAPAPRAEEEVTLEPSREAVEKDLAENRLTKERLEKANDPRFSAAQQSREEVHEHAARAPGQLRKQESAKIASTRRQLGGDEVRSGAGMRRAHTATRRGERARQLTAAQREAAERRRIAADIEGLYQATETAVRGKLEWLSGKDGEPGEVDRRFDAGEKAARDAFEKHVDEEMSAWKRRRYGGRASIPLIGGLVAAGTWAYDKVMGIDDHPAVKQIFEDGRELYLTGLEKTIEEIAGVVESTLAKCHERIDEGRKEIKSYVEKKGLDPSLKKVAQEAAAAVSEKFDDLRSDVDATREQLADQVADRYQESQQAIDERIQEMQAENRGLAAKFAEKLRQVLDAIRNFRKKIGPILAEAGDVIDDILDDPIGFLKNLLSAIGRGFGQFKERIDTHLRKGVIAWLFGNLSSIGVEPPKDFSLSSLGGVVLDVLGFTADKLKKRAARMVGPRAMGVAEKVTGYVGSLFSAGPAGLWKEIEEDVGDLKEKILEEIKSWVITRIITAAVKKLAMMFNPVGAIVQAILTIYDVIMFFLENIDRILDLVRTVVRAAADVVKGKIQTAADKIETALGATIPLILAFLARLVNLSGVTEKVRSVIRRFKTKVDRAIKNFLRKLVARFKVLGKKALAKGKKTLAAIAGWWKKKRHFKVGKTSHTMGFEGDRLIVHSKPRTLAKLVAEHKTMSAQAKKTGKGQEKDLSSLYGKAIELEKAVIRMKKRDSHAARKKGGASGLSAAEAKKYDDLLTIVRKLLSDLQAKSSHPDSLIQYHESNNGLGKRSEAQVLSIRAKERGTGVTDAPGKAVWDELKKRKAGSGSYYERAHLISRDFHGKGSREENIVPMWRKSNQNFEKQVEGPVKTEVWSEGKVMKLDVRADFGGAHHSTLDSWLGNLDTLYDKPEKKDMARKIIEAEKKLPDALIATAKVVVVKEGKTSDGTTLFSDRRIPNVFPATPPASGAVKKATKPSLSRSEYRILQGAGMSKALALLAVGLGRSRGHRPFKNFAEFEREALAMAGLSTGKLPGYLKEKPDPVAWVTTQLAALAPKVPGTIDL